jgi:hypothetical protein
VAISIDWATGVISVPQADLTFESGTLYALDTDQFWADLKTLEASEIGIVFGDTHTRTAAVTIAGVTYAPGLIIIAPYTVTFEDGQYAVRLDGTNNNIFDEGVINRNQVSIIPTNSAGLQIVSTGSGLTPTEQTRLLELWQRLGLDTAEDVTYTDTGIVVGGITLTISQPDGNTTVVERT